jgi:hypothetical protein
MTRDDGTLRAGGRGVNEPLRMALEAYHDRELSWWRQRKMERRLRRSPALQHELELLRQISVGAVAVEAAGASPDLWSDISSRLGAIDAERQSRGAAPAAANRRDPLSALRGLFGLPELFSWKPVGLAVAAGAAALAIGLWNTSGTVPVDPNGGVLRYLDTGGKSVMVVDNADVTIIWLMEGGGDGV